MSTEPTDDALLDIALAVADGGEVPWQELREQVPPSNAAIVDALQAVRQLALARQSNPDRELFVPVRWGHLNILGVSNRVDETQFAARDDALGREVVLTLIGPLEGDAVRTERLLQQARLRAHISHPHLAAVYGADYAQDRVGYWAERVDGRSLADIVSSGGRYGVRRACDIVSALCSAIGALHAAGLSNGGVSPAHVVESTDQRVVLLPSLDSQVHRQGARPPCSPETDIFDLGALLLFLLTGLQTQNDRNQPELLDRVHQLRPDIRPPLIGVIGRCLSTDSPGRFSTAMELDEAIRAATTDRPVPAEWAIGFVLTTLLMLLLVWYALTTY